MNRICVYTKDIQNVTGLSERAARNVIKDIKLLYTKEKHQMVTIREFCEYMDLPYDEVFAMINNCKKTG